MDRFLILGNTSVLPSLTQLACDTRDSVFSRAHTSPDKTSRELVKISLIPTKHTYFSPKMLVFPYLFVSSGGGGGGGGGEGGMKH